MDPVPYEIREEDVDEVLDAYEPTGGGEWPEEARQEARRLVMKRVTDIDETVRSVPEGPTSEAERGVTTHTGPESDRPGDRGEARRGMALAAIEDVLIRDGFLDLDEDESRVFPAAGGTDSERDDA
ncbi:MAG: hypothetical protein KY466_07405 [Gemmatimonadetes bacterium]|nr:hypothetical protein [Gemmatimonadota bacterium]